MTWWQTKKYRDKDAIICDGSIRSSKTVSMSIGFILWTCSCFNGQTFAVCGKTIESLRRNVITQLPTLFEGLCKITERKSENLMVVSLDGRVNKYYLFGGKDEGSAALIQGMTLAGVMFDEVALMPRSFVEQALARCSVEGSKFWFNCNPDAPEHWFRKEWILKHEEKNALYLHFTMEDNYSLSEKIKKRYESMYTGVFYDRFIRGLWVAAEGLIYQQFADNENDYLVDVTSDYLTDVNFVSIGIDFGGTRSLTTFVASAIHKHFSKVTVLADYHIKGTKGDIDADRVCREFAGFVERLRAKHPNIYIKYVFADSEAQYLINSLRRYLNGLEIGDSAKNPIIQRIIAGNTLLNTGRMLISKDCELVRNGLKQAMWDKNKKDTRLDNFSTDIDILDAYEYSWERFMTRLCPNVKGR